MVPIRIGVVSFNQNERLAVDELLSDLAIATSPWQRAGEQAIKRRFGNDDWRLEHFPLNAQGNVVAAVQLAKLFGSSLGTPNFVVFYGCAGAVDPKHTHSAFLVEAVNYEWREIVQKGATSEHDLPFGPVLTPMLAAAEPMSKISHGIDPHSPRRLAEQFAEAYRSEQLILWVSSLLHEDAVLLAESSSGGLSGPYPDRSHAQTIEPRGAICGISAWSVAGSRTKTSWQR